MALVVSAVLTTITLLAAAIPSFGLSGSGNGDDPLFPAPPGYLLPWPGGQIHTVTQGEDTTFTHNGVAAYAFDFDLNYDTVVASRSGRVALVYDFSNVGGCDPRLAGSGNYIVIDHGDGTSALYLHLAYDAALVAPGDLVERGQPIAVSGDTGVTCADEGDGAAPHLHFQVQETKEGHYFSQSLPVAFDDVGTNEGVPIEGESYVSGNYGKGRPQKIKLTPYRAERVFAPKATPADPALVEAIAPPPEQAPVEDPMPEVTDTVAPEITATEIATETPVPTYTDTPAPAPTDTPTAVDTPTATNTPPVTDTPAVPTQTPEPPPADTPTPDPPATEPSP